MSLHDRLPSFHRKYSTRLRTTLPPSNHNKDRTIISVAIPAISNEFTSFGDISWYETAFLLSLGICQLPMGKIPKYFSTQMDSYRCRWHLHRRHGSLCSCSNFECLHCRTRHFWHRRCRLKSSSLRSCHYESDQSTKAPSVQSSALPASLVR